MNRPCPDAEALFVGLAEEAPEARAHLAECDACAALVEEHRQLEIDLLRLSDPLPPPDFVHQVMARVEAQPVPAGREWLSFAGIVAAALAGVVVLVGSDAATAGAWGQRVAEWAGGARVLFEAAGEAAFVVWETAALPVTVAAAVTLMVLAVAARRFWTPVSRRVRA